MIGSWTAATRPVAEGARPEPLKKNGQGQVGQVNPVSLASPIPLAAIERQPR